MRFNSWKIDDLIEWLISCKSSELIDCHCVTRCTGEISLRNAEEKEKEDGE